MKRAYLLLSGLIASSVLLAQEPEIIPSMLALYMSPNGEWVGSQAGYSALYNTRTGEMTSYAGGYFGFGNCIANNGMGVGDGDMGAMIMYNGEMIYPENLNLNRYCSPAAITPDATRITGYMSVPGGAYMEYVPFVADMDENGNVGEPIALPVPEKDFFRRKPSYITAQCISEDGKTVVGMVTDGRGIFNYPIIFTEDEEGNWSYSTPSEPLFNPTHIEIPDNPWENSPSYPYPVNFMNGTAADAYEEAYSNWAAGVGPQPLVEDFMTETQYQQYLDAYEKYNYWYEHQAEIIQEYVDIYNELLGTSPTFTSDILAIIPSGDYFMTHGGVIDEENNMVGKIFKFTRNGEIEEINGPEPTACPRQILSDGTLVVANTTMDGLGSWIRLPNSKEFISIQDYLSPKYNGIAQWMNENLENSGAVTVSDDLSVIVGGLTSDLLLNDDASSSFRFASYIITGLEAAGVEEFSAMTSEGIYNVYNLQGVKVLETKDSELLKSLEKGIYIINGKKFKI